VTKRRVLDWHGDDQTRECSRAGMLRPVVKNSTLRLKQHLCTCGKPLLARYDLRRAAATLTLENLKARPRTLWRYAEVLPNDPQVSLGEGMTAWCMRGGWAHQSFVERGALWKGGLAAPLR